MATPAPEIPESKGCGNKSDNNKPGSFTTPAIEQQPQTLDGCGKPTEADFPTDTAHTPDPSLKDMSQSLPGCGAPTKTLEEMIDETVMAAKKKGSYLDGYEKKYENPEEVEDFKRQHPHGKYKGSSKHHEYSRGDISKTPRDGQKALNDSYDVQGSRCRVAIQDGKIIILKYEEDGVYHGFIAEDFHDLDERVQQSLVNNKLVRTIKSGKLVKK